MTPEDPWQLLHFRPDFIKEKKIRSIHIAYSQKSLGQAIIHKNFSHQLFFDTLGYPVKMKKTTNFDHYGVDSIVTFYIYKTDASSGDISLMRTEEKGNGTERIIYRELTDDGELITTVSRAADEARLGMVEKKRIDINVPESYVCDRETYINERLYSKSRDLFDEEDHIVDTETNYATGQKTQTNWEYLANKLTDMTHDENGDREMYKITYGKFSIINKIAHYRNAKLIDTMEYFYFEGSLESTLKITEGKSEFVITNYSYEYY